VKVAVDARELAGRPTGVGRYLSELLDRWADDGDAQRHEWRFFAHQDVALPRPFKRHLTVLPGSGGSAWEQRTFSRALRRDKPQVLFAPGYSAPLTAPAPVALTIHDVSFAAHPEWFSWREGLRRRSLTAWSARRARVVLTDSAFSRAEIVKHIGIPADRIRVVPLGLTRRFRHQGGAREPMVLFVGSIFQRRHVDTLIDVFVTHVATRLPDCRLEIVGEQRSHAAFDVAAALRRCPPDIADRVRLRSYVDENTLADLYRRASVFAFLSEYEGFGFTPLEAMSAGIPAVVLDTPVAREVYGPAARYVTSIASPEPLASTLIELMTDGAARDALLAEAEGVLRQYDWNTTAAATLRVIEEAAGG
jgi:glycosyltransferase involved in cell wall biosynthesis